MESILSQVSGYCVFILVVHVCVLLTMPAMSKKAKQTKVNNVVSDGKPQVSEALDEGPCEESIVEGEDQGERGRSRNTV